MSYLNSFRINFYGGCTTNVSTANNAYFKGYVDPVETMVTGDFAAMSDEEVIQALRSDYTDDDGELQGGPLAGWNYYGNHFTPFQDAKIASAGPPGAVSEDTELANAPIFLLGSKDPCSDQGPFGSPVMVDQDPTGGVGTQIFVGGFQIGSDDDIKLKVMHDTVCYSYFLGTRTPCASSGAGGTNACAIWQLHFPASAIECFDENDDVAKIVAAARAADGFVMRFSTFEMGAVLGGQELLDKFANGEDPVNPALGYVVGTIGVHQETEFKTCPPGRLLNPVPLYARLGSPGFAESVNVDGTTYASLDLVNVIPKIPRPNIADISTLGPNEDIGPLELVAGSTTIGPVDYRRADYFKFGGIVDVPVSPGDINALNNSALKIQGTATNPSYPGTLIAEEQEIRICSDDRVTYFAGEQTCTIRVTQFGGPPQQAITLNLATSSSSFFDETYPDPRNLTYPDTLTVQAGSGDISFPVSETGPGMCLLHIALSGTGQGLYFMNFRVYPDDDYSAEIAEGNLQWDFVYEQVLRYYYVLFPAMSKIFPLNSEETVKNNGPGIIKRTSDQYRDTTLHMPITRAMSPGKRDLLVAFLEQEAAKKAS